jgi:DNA-binding MarR family transcriptional regulator
MRYSSYVARSLVVRPIDAATLHHLSRGPLTPTQLGARVGAGSGSLTAIVDRLEQAGMVARTPHPRDRRSVSVSLTASGRARLTAQTADLLDATQAVVDRLSPAQQRTVEDFLHELALVLEREAPAH